MNEPYQADDGQWAIDLADGRTLTGDHYGMLVEIAERLATQDAVTAAFLDAWKRGVQIAGTRYFEVTAISVGAATDKNELRPDTHAIRDHAGALSPGERVFLLALLSFFNTGEAAALCAAFDERIDPGSLAGRLDDDRLAVITDLMQTYTGW